MLSPKRNTEVDEQMPDVELDDSYLDSDAEDSFDLYSDEEDEDDDDEEEGEGGPLAGKLKFVIIGVVVVVLVAATVLIGKNLVGGDGEEDEPPEQQQEQVVTDSGLVYSNTGEEEEPLVEEPQVNASGLTDADEQMYNDAIGIGVQNLTGDTVDRNTTGITGDDFTKDYSSTDIPMYYEIKSIRQVKDYISYTKYRTSTADGIELYWLDGEYHGKPVRLTTTLSVFKELSSSGVIPVIVEVTMTKDGNQLITGFTVDTASSQ